MFAFHHLPESGGRGLARPDRQFRFDSAGPAEIRRSRSALGFVGPIDAAASPGESAASRASGPDAARTFAFLSANPREAGSKGRLATA